MTINIALSEEIRKKVCEQLGKLLSDEYFLYLKTLNFHWNITGENFISLHEMLESQYEWLKEVVDEIAERIRTLGYKAPGTFQEMSKKVSVIQESDGNKAASAMLKELVDSHEAVIRELRNMIKTMEDTEDYATEDMMIQWLSGHEKKTWMLRSHLQQKPE